MTNDDNNIFEQIRETWPNAYVHFILAYRCTKKAGAFDLKWCKAVSSSNLTKKHYDEIATRYQEIALQSYVQNRNFVIRDNLPTGDLKTNVLYGLVIPQKPNPMPANALGQRWWKFVIGSGALRNAGFILVARVAAIDTKEIKKHIDRIQSIVAGNLP